MQRDTCKHYTGSYHNRQCGAGVTYSDVTPKVGTPGWVFLQPCKIATDPHALNVIQELGPQGTCDKFELPSAEEVRAENEAMETHFKQFQLTLPLIERIKREHKDEDWQGVEVCPVCQGRLHLSITAYNGHVWGKCDTEDCLSWME
jgi:hypothetical protein